RLACWQAMFSATASTNAAVVRAAPANVRKRSDSERSSRRVRSWARCRVATSSQATTSTPGRSRSTKALRKNSSSARAGCIKTSIGLDHRAADLVGADRCADDHGSGNGDTGGLDRDAAGPDAEHDLLERVEMQGRASDADDLRARETDLVRGAD